MKRRQFTQFFALLGGSLALPALARDRSALNVPRAGSAMEQMSRDYFEARVGKTFYISGAEPSTLVLKRIENACGEHCREQFHTVFEVSSGKRLNDGIFRLERAHSDRIDLFLTRSAHSDNGQQPSKSVTEHCLPPSATDYAKIHCLRS